MFKCKTLSAFSIKWQPGLLRKTAKDSPVLSFLSLPPSTCTSKQETSRDCRRQPGKEKKGFTVSRALPWPAPQACARHGGGLEGGEMVPVCNPLTKPREVALGFHMGNNRSCRDEEKEGICWLPLREAAPRGPGAGSATREGSPGRVLSPALPGRTEGCCPSKPSWVWAEASAGGSSQLWQLQPLAA